MWRQVLTDPHPVSGYHSLIDAEGRRHQILTVAHQIINPETTTDQEHVAPRSYSEVDSAADLQAGSGAAISGGAGAGMEITGYVSDLTAPLHEDVAYRANDAIARAARNRAEIEQAKGILMAFRGLDADQAFLAITRYSQHHNQKVSSLARALVYACGSTTTLHLTINAICPTTNAA